MPHFPVNYDQTGWEIAETVIAGIVGPREAKSIIIALNGHTYPLTILQQGSVTRLLQDIVNKTAEVEALRNQVCLPQPEDLATRVFQYCEKSHRAGKSPLETAFQATKNFPDPGELGLAAVGKVGDSVELKIPHGPYVAFDHRTRLWAIRETSLSGEI